MLGVRPRSCRRTKRSVNEPRSSGSLRISGMTLMGLCPLFTQSGHLRPRSPPPNPHDRTALPITSAGRFSPLGASGHQNDPGLRLRTLRPSRSIWSQELSATSTEAAHFFAFWSASAMFAASMEAPSYGASKLPFAIRHRLTVYATKFASCVGYPLRYSGSSLLSARWLRLRSFRYSAIAPKISFLIFSIVRSSRFWIPTFSLTFTAC
jgi:hypothetical protein